MTHRFFRASPAVYEQVRAQVDSAWGYPTKIGTQTCIPPADEQSTDSQGRCLLAVLVEWTTWEPVATLLPQMIAVGQVEEISEAEYWAAVG